MEEENRFLTGVLLAGMISLLIILLLSIPCNVAEGYRQGQIDAINGVIKFELQTHDDGTTSWELKDDA